MILLIDNYDSFTYNLAHLFGELGAEVVVHRNDEITADEAAALDPTHLGISPRPGRPGGGGGPRGDRANVCRAQAAARRLPRPPGDRRRLRRRGGPCPRARPRQGD